MNKKFSVEEIKKGKIQVIVSSAEEADKFAKLIGYGSAWTPHNANYPIFAMAADSTPLWLQNNYFSRGYDVEHTISFSDINNSDAKAEIIGYECIKAYPGVKLGYKNLNKTFKHEWYATNNEFWRPIYKEIPKAGDWVIYKHTPPTQLWKEAFITPRVNKEYLYYTDNHCNAYTSDFRHATATEIERAMELAKLKIGIYNVTFEGDIVKVGCKSTHIDEIVQLHRLMKYINITDIVINKEIISLEKISKIIDVHDKRQN